jgi:hypothetical protein
MSRCPGEAEVCYSEWLLKKLCCEAISDFWGFPNQQNEIRNILMLAHKVPAEGFPHLEEAHRHEDIEPLISLNEPMDD